MTNTFNRRAGGFSGAFALAGSLTFAPVFAHAQASTPSVAEPDLRPASESRTTWGIGLAEVSKQLPYVGVDRENRLRPMLYFENAWIRFAGTGAEVKLGRVEFSPSNALSFGLRFRYDGDGYKASDSPYLAGMNKRKGSLWGGAVVTWRNDLVDLSAEALSDLSGHSKGQVFELKAERRINAGAFSLTPRVQAQWLGTKVVDYYFGVRPEEALADRPVYKGTSGVSLEAGLRVDYALTPRQSVFLDVSGTRLPNEATDSPLVDRSSSSRAVIGYLYRF